MKKILLLCIVMVSLACHATRQEDNINQMIISMHHEFTLRWNDARKNSVDIERQLMAVDTLLHDYNDNSKQCVMTIYSTDDNSFQDVAFESQNAMTLYDDFMKSTQTYTTMLSDYRQRVHRQDSLAYVLRSIDTNTLKPKAKAVLCKLFSLINSLQAYDRQVLQRLERLHPLYQEAHNRLKKAKQISQQKYELIRSNVLSDFDGDLFDIISDWDGYMQRIAKGREMQASVDKDFYDLVKEKGVVYALQQASKDDHFGISSWGMLRVILLVIIISAFFARAMFFALIACVFRWITKRICMLRYWARTRYTDAAGKVLRAVTYLSGIKTFTLFTVWIDVLCWCWMFTMADDDTESSGMMDSIGIELFYFSTLLAVIMTFFVLRYSGRQFWRSLAVCTPTLLAFAYSLVSIIMVMSDDEIIVETTFLSVILFAIQSLIFMRWHGHLDDLMARISQMSMFFMGLSMVMALLGLQFLSTMVVVFCSTFMVCFMLLTLLKRYLDQLFNSYSVSRKSVRHTWWIPIINRVIYPMAWIYAVLLSCKTACSIYSLDDFLNYFLNTYFTTPLGHISINVNMLIFICWSVLFAAYLSNVIYKFVDSYHLSRGDANWKDTSFFNQGVIRFLVWGGTIINIMLNMGFNLEWMTYCMAGLSTGLGFASREILENLIYGLTLRNGKLKIGDWIVCDGVRGQIKSIGLLSTRMESVEGSVITFTNSKMMTLNYQNITLNHGYELLHTPFCVNYGEDIDKIRRLIIDGYTRYDCYDKSRAVAVVVKQINNNQVDLDFKVWIPASDRIRLAAFNMEYVYKTLNGNGIKYPYPFIEVSNVE